MPTVTHTTDERFGADVLAADPPVVVDFTASWCPPCQILNPIVEELASEHPEVRFVALDVDEHQATAARYRVLSMPTLIVFRGGAPVATLVGARPKARLRRELSEVLPEMLAEQSAGR
jgi:thioredoxin 1